MKTYSPKAKDLQNNWYVVDATDKILGRLAAEVALYLRGKHKPEFVPYMDNGDFVIIVNAEKIKVTGNKLSQKKYYRHSGYIGGLKETDLGTLLRTKPERAIEYAVKGMLPKNALGRAIYKKLKVYAGPNHPHTAQNPTTLDI